MTPLVDQMATFGDHVVTVDQMATVAAQLAAAVDQMATVGDHVATVAALKTIFAA